MNLVIIEDDQSIRENLHELLENYDFSVKSYPDGLQGLEGIKKTRPDLVICDIMTPQMDGYEVLEALKSKEETATIPFIFLTAKVERADQRKGMEMGADDYIVKPFTAKEIINSINTRLKKQENTREQLQMALYDKLNVFTKINSHEYNTPLNGIIGLSDTLEHSFDQLDKQEIMEMIKAIRTSAKRLHRTFKNFILYILLQRGQLSSPKVRMNDQLLEQLLFNLLSVKASKFNRSEDVKFKSDLGSISIDLPENDFYFVVEELIWNALKFSKKETEVNVHIYKTEKEIRIAIKNCTGNQDFFTKTEPFMQFDRDSNEQQGSGLGLYLSKKIAEYYNWELKKEFQNDTATLILSIKI